MKKRITLTIEPALALRAKRLARNRNTSVSGLVESLVCAAPLSPEMDETLFVDRWAGKFQVANPKQPDARMEALKARHGLNDQ